MLSRSPHPFFPGPSGALPITIVTAKRETGSQPYLPLPGSNGARRGLVGVQSEICGTTFAHFRERREKFPGPSRRPWGAGGSFPRVGISRPGSPHLSASLRISPHLSAPLRTSPHLSASLRSSPQLPAAGGGWRRLGVPPGVWKTTFTPRWTQEWSTARIRGLVAKRERSLFPSSTLGRPVLHFWNDCQVKVVFSDPGRGLSPCIYAHIYILCI